MRNLLLLQRDWHLQLANLVNNAKRELIISSPYVTQEGVDLVNNNVSPSLRNRGRLSILTDLAPLNICQGSTDPKALQSLAGAIEDCTIWHLPRLHAKVYLADSARAMVTSGNLTGSGLMKNYEYGIGFSDRGLAGRIREDILDFARLGACISYDQLILYCQFAGEMTERIRKEKLALSKAAQHKLKQLMRAGEDRLIRLRLATGPIHSIFSETILYLLKSYGPLNTKKIHHFIKQIHPDLCDDNEDRVIDGQHFGKKWKHAVRTAQQHLKTKGLIRLIQDEWAMQTISKN